MSGSYGSIDSASWSDYARVLEHTQKRSGTSSLGVRSVPVWTSCRWMIAYICFAGSVVILSLQQDMSMALVCMFPRELDTSNDTSLNVNGTALIKSNDSKMKTDSSLDWDQETQGLLLSAQFYGAMISPIIAGFLATRYGGKQVMAISVGVAILSTVVTPPAAYVSPWLVFFLRVVLGFAGAMFNPAVQALLTKWSPFYDRTKMIAFCFSGVNLGNVISYAIPGLVCEVEWAGGWPLIFYILSGLGVAWLIWVFFGIYNSPEQHPRITDIEQHYIISGMPGAHNRMAPTLPWLHMIRSVPMWVCIISQFVNMFCQLVQQLNVPMYMRDVLQLSIEQNGLLSTLPALGRLIGTLTCGFASDVLIKRNIFSVWTTRRVFFIIGFVLPAVAMFGLGYIGPDQKVYAVILLVIAGTTSSGGMVTIRVNLTDIAPRVSSVRYPSARMSKAENWGKQDTNHGKIRSTAVVLLYSSILLGILMCVSGIVGMIEPVIVTMATDQGTQEQWQVVFTICAGLYILGAMVFVVFGSSEEQWWACTSEYSVSLLGEQSRGRGGIHNGYIRKQELVIPEPPSSATSNVKVGTL